MGRFQARAVMTPEERAQVRWAQMSVAAKCEWLLSELGPQMILWSETLNPDNLSLAEAVTGSEPVKTSFHLEAWGRRCVSLAQEIRDECGKQKTRNLIISQ